MSRKHHANRSVPHPHPTGLIPRLISGGAGVAVVLAGHVVGLLLQRAVTRKRKGDEDVPLPVVSAGYAAYYVALFVSLSIALRLNGIDTSALLAVLSAAGFTIGLALQGPLSNAAAGMFLTVGGGFSVGDAISVNGITGVVTGFTLFQTTLKNTQGDSIVVPNKMLSEGIVTNLSHFPPASTPGLTKAS
jgi:small conductance mechanosensitive channel